MDSDSCELRKLAAGSLKLAIQPGEIKLINYYLQRSYKIVRDKLLDNKIKNKTYYDKKAKEKTFDIGEQVQMLNENVRQGRSKKLGPQWLGPYVVTDSVGNSNYEIKKGRTKKIVHADKLKNYYD